jgi:muramoyltetrapeptide carboxypeptidase
VKIPQYLVSGETILIIATGRKVSKDYILKAVEIFESWGLNVELSPTLYNEFHQFAGTDLERAEGLQWALDHSTAKAIIVACGGYGTLRIINEVSFDQFLKTPKWIVGFSDVTVLHSHVNRLGVAAISGPMPKTFHLNEAATLSIKKLLFNEELNYNIALSDLNILGEAEGTLIGGNLSLLYALSGSESEIDFADKILFIEDVDEMLYHIDRMMMQLKRAGKLKNLKGLIVGGMTDMKDNAIPYGFSAEEIIFEHIKGYNFPVCFNFPSGHTEQNLALYLGKEVELNIQKDIITLKYL